MGQVLIPGRKRMYGTLPEQVSSFYAARGNAQVTLTWSNPSAEYAGTLIVRKTGSYSQRPSDGIKIYKGTGTHYTDTGLTNGTQYYYRAFAYNSRGEYQTISRIATATPVDGFSVSELPVGGLVKVAEDGVLQQYIVIQQGNPDETLYDKSCNGTWILRKNISEKRQWNGTNNNTYSSSTIHAYLNNDFFTSLLQTSQNAIKQIKIPYSYWNDGNQILATGTSGLDTKIFLLSSLEIGITAYGSDYLVQDSKMLSLFLSGNETEAIAKRAATMDGSDCEWYTRTVNPREGTTVLTNKQNGEATCVELRGVRPAMILDSASLVVSYPDTFGCYELM